MNPILAVLAGLVVLFLPGLACLAWLDRSGRSFWEHAADAAGLSYALTALLALLFYLLRLPPGGWGLGVYYGLSLLFLAAALLAGRVHIDFRVSWPAALGGLALLGVLTLRFVQVSGLAFPSWVDSVHHTLVVRKMLAYGGLPPDLTPFLNAPFSYHYGFHIQAAAFAALTGMPADQAVLWFGQSVNALVALAIYRLARSNGQGQGPALLAGLISGCVLYMPAYYATWGRYPLSSGLMVLPLAMSGGQELMAEPRNWRLALKLALLTGGLCLTHYLALLMFAFFLAVIAIEKIFTALRQRSWRAIPWETAGACLAGVGLALPWLIPMLLFNSASVGVGEPRLAFNPKDFDGLLSLLRPAYDLNLMAVAAVCLLLAFFKPGMRRMAAWGLILLFFAMPFAPQPGPFRPDLFTIVLFVPAALLLAWGISGGAAALARVYASRPGDDPAAAPRGMFWVWVPVSLGLLVLGVRQTRQIINPGTLIADRADRAALDWVAANTPPDARFYVNSVRWMSNVYRGVDGGYWLLPYAERQSLVPPVFYVWEEETSWKQIDDWAERAGKLTGCTPDFWAIVREANLTYVYAREGKGNLQPKELDQCPRLQPLYRQDGIVIYQILKP